MGGRRLGRTLLAVAIAMAGGSLSPGADPLIPHRIKDMILLGEEGQAQSLVTRSVFFHQGYVYASGQPGLATVDARNPADLKLVAEWTQSSAQVNGAAVADDVLYLANWSPGAGLVLFDVSQPAAPAHMRTIATAAHTWEAVVHGDLLYVSIDDGTITGLNTYDIADRRNPQFVNFLSMDDRLVGNATRRGDILYVSHKNWLRIFNVRNPADPRFIREMAFNGLCGEARVRGDFLFLLTREIMPGEEGGVHVFSLEDAYNPQARAYFEQPEPRDLHFQGDFLVVPASGSGIYTFDVSDPANLRLLAHWSVSWPGMGHGGYPVTVAGERNHIFVGTTGGNNPECEDTATCSYWGGRLYSVQISVEPPRIAPPVPDPDTAYAGLEYVKQLVLLEGEPAPTWSVVSGPPGMSVNANGVIRGWVPAAGDVGQTFTARVRASNAEGASTVSWGVRVAAAPPDLVARFPFEGGADGWTLAPWRSGPYDPGSAAWEASEGNPGGNICVRGSGATNNQDTCNREGASMTRAVSTEGRSEIRIQYEVLADLDDPPGSSGAGSCTVLEGTSEDKLVLYYSAAGAGGPWVRAQFLNEGASLPCGWTRFIADLTAIDAVEDNPNLALRFTWQFNTAADTGRIDNVCVLGMPLVRFRRGDANADGEFNIADPICALSYLFAKGDLRCADAADANASGELNIADPIAILSALFGAHSPLPEPFERCGADPTANPLGCASFPPCE